jgi:glycosyltransferase involved in cell wall biosynthesis
VISVVIPAHNEAAVVGRVLDALLADARPGEFEVIVVPNGCSDETEAIAAAYGPPVTVVASPVGSKAVALRLGDGAATAFPRIYLDADVVLGTGDARRLAVALQQPGVLAVGPQRDLALDGRPLVVRWYYDVWSNLPVVRDGLFGRGVIAVSEEGHRRMSGGPEVMADDLAASVAFTADERRVVEGSRVVVHVPRTGGDLLRRRVRALTSTAELAEHAPEAVGGARTSRADLVGLLKRRPTMAPKLAVFLGVTLVARRQARKPIATKDYQTWLRDESSRT